MMESNLTRNCQAVLTYRNPLLNYVINRYFFVKPNQSPANNQYRKRCDMVMKKLGITSIIRFGMTLN